MPMPYGGMYYPQNQQYQNMQQLQNMQQPLMTQQNSNGFIIVRSEEEARNYPVGFGNNVLFKDETAPFVYSKTMGFSQLDKPVFEKYRLVKEESKDVVSVQEKVDNTDEIKNEISAIWNEINALKKEIDDGV